MRFPRILDAPIMNSGNRMSLIKLPTFWGLHLPQIPKTRQMRDESHEKLCKVSNFIVLLIYLIIYFNLNEGSKSNIGAIFYRK